MRSDGGKPTAPGDDPRDPWWIQRWARAQRVGNSARKLLLQLLAEAADHNTGACEPKQATLAEWAELSTRALRSHLQTLETAGLIARREQRRMDGGRRSDQYLILAPGITEWPEGVPVAPPEESSYPPGSLLPTPPEAAASGQGQPQRDRPLREGGSARARRDELAQHPPEGFPDELRPHARHVFAVLKQVAEQHGAKMPTPLALGQIIMARPRRPLIQAAHDFAAWAATAPPRKDVVAGYRNWLDKLPDLAAIEPLPGEGPTVNGVPAGVTPLRQPRTAEERRMERQRRRLSGLPMDGSGAMFPSVPEIGGGNGL